MEDMSYFMEKGEPEFILPLSPQAQKNHGLVGEKPFGRSIPWHLPHFPDQRQSHAGFGAKFFDFGFENFRFFSRKGPNFF